MKNKTILGVTIIAEPALISLARYQTGGIKQ